MNVDLNLPPLPLPLGPTFKLLQHLHPQHQALFTKQSSQLRACTECGATDTPQWRQGPSGRQSLCNACGVRRIRSMRRSRGEPERGSKGGNGGSDDYLDDSDTGTDTSRGTAPAAPASQPSMQGQENNNQHHSTHLNHQHKRKRGSDNEAALSLLSMAAAAVKEEKAAAAVASKEDEAPGPGQDSGHSTQQAQRKEEAKMAPPASNPPSGCGSAMEVLSLISGEALQALMGKLTPQQLATLQDLCRQYDSCYKELVAAHAARDAVAKILQAKQEEARQAAINAERLAEQLYIEVHALAQQSQ